MKWNMIHCVVIIIIILERGMNTLWKWEKYGDRDVSDVNVMQGIRDKILEQAEEMEVEDMFKEAGLPWPVLIPEEELEEYERKEWRKKEAV